VKGNCQARFLGGSGVERRPDLPKKEKEMKEEAILVAQQQAAASIFEASGHVVVAQCLQIMCYVLAGGAVLISVAIIIHALITRKKASAC